MKKFTAQIKGRVQGVGFRYFVYHEAERLGVKGYVMNLDNGDVHVCAEGNETTLKTFVQELWRGPRFSEVEDVDIEWADGESEFSFFSIRH